MTVVVRVAEKTWHIQPFQVIVKNF